MELKSIDVLSFSVVMGLVFAVMGLIMGILVAIFGAGIGSIAGLAGVGVGAFVGVGAIVIFPVMAFIQGFIGGAIFTLVYNFVASMYKGIEIELK